MEAPAGDPKCNHFWVYDRNAALVYPTDYKICAHCGRMEYVKDTIYMIHTFQEIYNKFHGGDKVKCK